MGFVASFAHVGAERRAGIRPTRLVADIADFVLAISGLGRRWRRRWCGRRRRRWVRGRRAQHPDRTEPARVNPKSLPHPPPGRRCGLLADVADFFFTKSGWGRPMVPALVRPAAMVTSAASNGVILHPLEHRACFLRDPSVLPFLRRRKLGRHRRLPRMHRRGNFLTSPPLFQRNIPNPSLTLNPVENGDMHLIEPSK